MLWKFLQRSWGGGQLDRELSGRQDLAKYFIGASKIRNLMVRRQGNLTKRRGTDRVAGLKNILGVDAEGRTIPVDKVRMIPVECDDNGRYIIMTGGCAFIGNRDGILLCDGSRVRDVDPYEALDDDGNRKVYFGFDAKANSSKPVCIVRNMGSSGNDIIWYDTLAQAIANVMSGDKVELHANILVESTITCPSVSFTLDLYGYKITVRGQYTSLLNNGSVSTAKTDILITSSRIGAIIDDGAQGSRCTISLTGAESNLASNQTTVTIDGDIEWYRGDTWFGGAAFVNIRNCKSLTINSGWFHSDYSSHGNETGGAGNLLYLLNTDCTINGGRIENNSGYSITHLIYAWRKVIGDKVYGTLTINGGSFVSKCSNGASSRSYNSAIDVGRCHIYGGYFYCDGYLFKQEFTDSLYIHRGVFEFGGENASREIDFIDSASASGTVHNEAFPNGSNRYGWKLEGEDDYDIDSIVGDRRPFCMKIPYADEDLNRLCVKQVGDVVFIAHHLYPPAKIAFDANGFATIEDIKFDDRVWKRPNIDSCEMSGNSHTTVSESTQTSTTTVKQWVGDQKDGEWKTATNTNNSTSKTESSVPESPHTVKYAVTYVKDGFESEMSKPYKLTYMRPWNTGATVSINFSRGENDEEPDYYNIYKDQGGGFGLIGTTADLLTLTKDCAYLNTERLWTPVPNAKELMLAMDYEEQNGLSSGGLARRICASSRTQFPSGTGSDACVFLSSQNASKGITFTMTDKTAKSARFWLDGRIRDTVSNGTWIIISTPRVTVTVTGKVKSGESEVAKTQVWNNLIASIPPQKSNISGFSGFRAGDGIYEDFVGLSNEKITLPNGDFLYASFVGKGSQVDWFNAHLRKIDVDFTADGTIDWTEIETVKLTFTTSVYSDWTNNQQGCIHAAEFFAESERISGTGGDWQDSYITPDMSITPPFEYDADEHFAGAGDYPACVGMWGEKAQRLCFASTDNSPLTFWLSCTGDLYNFTRHKSIREDDAIEAQIAATEQPNINHIIIIKDLMLLTDGGEWAVTPVTGNVLSYKTVSAKQHSAIGANKSIEPISVGDEMLFVNRVGEEMSSVRYNAISENYESKDLTVMSQNIFKDNPVVSMAYKQHPDSVIECVLKDGTIATLVYMKEHEVAAWSVQVLGGGYKAKQVGCTKSIVNGTSEIMILAEIGGAYEVLKVRDEYSSPSIEAQVCMDGVQDLSGKEILKLANTHRTVIHKTTGTVLTQDEIAGGTKTVNINDQYMVGHPFESELVTVRPEPQGGGETIQFEVKNSTETEIRVCDATTFRVRAFGVGDQYLKTVKIDPVFDGSGKVSFCDVTDCLQAITGANKRDGRIQLLHDEPWAFSLLSIGTTYQVEMRNINGRSGGGDE